MSEVEHDELVSNLQLSGGFFTSAKTGEQVLRSFYKAVGESCGIALTPAELACYNKVVFASVLKTADEGRTPYADAIEAEDLALEAAKNKACCTVS